MIWLFSRSTSSAFHKCPREGYYRYFHLGQGIEPVGVSEHLLQGTFGHDGCARLATGGDPLEIIPSCGEKLMNLLLADPSWEPSLREDFRKEKAEEWRRLTEGHLWAEVRIILPSLLENYEIVSVEESRIYYFPENPSLGLLAKPDLLLMPKTDRVPPGLTYLERKFFTPTKDWHRQYLRNPQAWSGRLAFPDVENFVVLGYDKGNMYKGMRLSPFTYCYQNTQGKRSYETERKRTEWKRVSTKDLQSWVNEMPLDLLKAQYEMTPVIPIDQDLMEIWRLQQLQEQSDLASLKADQSMGGDPDSWLDLNFPQWLDKCHPGGVSSPCAFNMACHTLRGRDLLESGLYKQRIPHHDLEIQLRAEGRVL